MNGLLLLVSTLLLSSSAPPLPGVSGRVADIPAPAGCTRTELGPGSYGAWLRNLPVKDRCEILAHDGSKVEAGHYRVMAVLDLPLLFRDDLEQCADWCFRLWAEYHRDRGKLDGLYLFDYGGRRRMYAGSGRSYKSFLRWAMASANSHSLKRGCAEIDTAELAPGDMLVQNRDGGVGHVSVVLDACRGGDGAGYFLIGYGYMPAQEFHIERSGPGQGADGWFTLAGYRAYLKERFDFGEPAFRRFR